MVFYLGPNIKEFCHVFRALGLVSGVNSWYVVCMCNFFSKKVGSVLNGCVEMNRTAVLPMQMTSMSLLHEPSDERLEEVATALCDMGRG